MIISLMLILLIPGKMAKGHKSGSGLIQWSREAIKILSILVFKLIRNNVIRKDTKTAVSFTLGGCFTYSQCLCWELCTFLLFNKFYSLATTSVYMSCIPFFSFMDKNLDSHLKYTIATISKNISKFIIKNLLIFYWKHDKCFTFSEFIVML